MEAAPLVDATAEEDGVPRVNVENERWRWLRRMLLLTPLAVVSIRGASLKLNAGSFDLTQLFVPGATGEAGELPFNNPYETDPYGAEHEQVQAKSPLLVLHRGYDCWQPCLGAGACFDFCGQGNACCRKGAVHDPPECEGITDFWTDHHECVKPAKAVEVNHFAQDCWNRCNIGGDCAWCGTGQACCRKNSTLDPPECHGVSEWPTDRHHTCVTPVKKVPVKHEGQDCYDFCQGRGRCNWCGEGNACCKYGDIYAPSECRAVVYFSSKEYHVCVKPSFPEPPKLPAVTRPEDAEDPLVQGSQKQTFYVYRLESGSEPQRSTNINAGSLGAILFAVHSQYLGCPRKQDVTRIHRWKVIMKNTEAMFRHQSRQFGPLHSFRNGQCVSSICNKTFEQFGYTVGCSRLASAKSSYPPAPAWYSLPGPCPSLAEGEKTEQCRRDFAGGECSDPTGTRTCTYHLEDAGFVTLDELSGRDQSTSLADWCAAGHLEYDPATDRGVGLDFWNGLKNGSLGKERMYKLAFLFWQKYPDYPKRLPEPCSRD